MTSTGGDTDDWEIVDPLELLLRAESDGDVTRVYTVEVEGRDDAGNAVRGTVEVKVPKS